MLKEFVGALAAIGGLNNPRHFFSEQASLLVVVHDKGIAVLEDGVLIIEESSRSLTCLLNPGYFEYYGPEETQLCKLESGRERHSFLQVFSKNDPQERDWNGQGFRKVEVNELSGLMEVSDAE